MGNNLRVTFLPDNIQVEVTADKNILQAAGQAGVELDGPCGGNGSCGKCRVRVLNEKGVYQWALACRTQVNRDMTVEIPQLEVSLHRKNELSLADLNVKIDPGIIKKAVNVTAASLENQHSDGERLLNALDDNGLEIRLEALRSLPKAVRDKKAKGLVTAVISQQQVLAVEPGDTKEKLFGIAVDIGTTSVVVALMNLITGETLGVASASNPQATFGADVIARIDHVNQNPEGLDQLNRRVIQVINRLAAKLAKDNGISPQSIYQMTVVGNTTMSHLFLKADPTNLATAPFIPVVSEAVQVEAKELGVDIAPHAKVYVTPSIAGYVGGDTIGVIMSTDLYKKEGIYLVIDIGTNGEIVLAKNGEMISCSTAAGPAFEGAQIRFGMRAAKGAIERVVIKDDVEIKVIGNQPAKGICGSGLMDAVAEMVQAGIIEASGRLLSKENAGHLPPGLQKRLGSSEDLGAYFILAYKEDSLGEEVVLTQRDIRELQLAKAAIAAGIQVLLEQLNLTIQEIDGVLLAGAFGSYINKFSALGIGLLPPIDPDRIYSVGNAAGAGARKFLVSKEMRQKAEKVARQVKHLELSARADFQDRFISSLSFSA
ncbi:MAG: ASKHA domain-containing protein [Bacillota bacterium]